MRRRVPRRKKKGEMLGAKIVRKRAKCVLPESRLSSSLLEALKDGDLTHRRTDKAHPKSTGYVVLFAEDEERNEHYGEHVWILRTNLPRVPKAVIKFASEHYDVGMGESEDLVNPDNIVDSAGAWDDPDFVSALWQEMECGRIKESPGYRTSDGAAVIDPHSVKLEYHHDDDDDDDDW